MAYRFGDFAMARSDRAASAADDHARPRAAVARRRGREQPRRECDWAVRLSEPRCTSPSSYERRARPIGGIRRRPVVVAQPKALRTRRCHRDDCLHAIAVMRMSG